MWGGVCLWGSGKRGVESVTMGVVGSCTIACAFSGLPEDPLASRRWRRASKVVLPRGENKDKNEIISV
jgi:hypothetical protein